MPKISIIIPVLNGIEMTKSVIEDIKRYTKNDYEIIILDSMSDDETYSVLSGLVNENFIYHESEENLWVN